MAANQISLKDEFHKMAGQSAVLGDPTGNPAYLYTRSSDRVQAQEGSESLSRQLLFAHDKALLDGRFIPLEMVYWDVWRGKDADRPAWHRFLTDVKQEKRSDIIYIDSTDRLSRNTAVYYVLLHDLTRYGINVRFAKDEDELIRHIKLAFDEMELEKRRYRQIQANRARASKGHVISKHASYGYDFSEDGLSYVINEAEAQWVRQIYELYVSGKSLRVISTLLNDNNVKSKFGRKLWSLESIRGLLKKEVYKGVYISNRYERVWVWENGTQKRIDRKKPESEWIYSSVPALVTEEIWDEAQKILAINKQNSLRNSKKHEWLLSGLIKCICGNQFGAKRKKSSYTLVSGEVQTYWREQYCCWNHLDVWRPDHCQQPVISKGKLESAILSAVELLLMDVSLWQSALDTQDHQIDHWTAHVELCQKQIKEIDNQINELLQMALEQRTPTMRQLFIQKQHDLEEQRAKFDEQLRISSDKLAISQRAIEQKIEAEELLQHLRKIGGLQDLPFEMKRQVLTKLVEQITLDTKEQWFEIKGVLREEICGFSYDNSGQLVSTSGARHDRVHARCRGKVLRHRAGYF